ncbi:MAG: sigma-70 family RNA polymerase sigma factor [Minicystis sp.]
MGLWILLAVQLVLTIAALVAVLFALAWARAAAKDGREVRRLVEEFFFSAQRRTSAVSSSATYVRHPPEPATTRPASLARATSALDVAVIAALPTGLGASANDCEEPAPDSEWRFVRSRRRKFTVASEERRHVTPSLSADRTFPGSPGDLYPLVQRALKRYRHGFAGDEKSDLCQRIVIAAWWQRHKYDPNKGTVGQWISGITLNCVREHLRAATREVLGMHLEEVVDGVDDQIELRDALRRGLQELSEIERAVVVAHAVEGRTFQEIADATGVPVTTAHTRYMTGIARLRVLLREK